MIVIPIAIRSGMSASGALLAPQNDYAGQTTVDAEAIAETGAADL
jgi:hypothetical protein